MKSHQINLSRLAIRTANASKASGGIVATMQGMCNGNGKGSGHGSASVHSSLGLGAPKLMRIDVLDRNREKPRRIRQLKYEVQTTGTMTGTVFCGGNKIFSSTNVLIVNMPRQPSSMNCGVVATRNMGTVAAPLNRIQPPVPVHVSSQAKLRTPRLSAAQRQNHVQTLSQSEGRSVRMALEISKSISDELMPITETVRSRICVVRQPNQKRDLLQGWKHPGSVMVQQSPQVARAEDVEEEPLARQVKPPRRQIRIPKPMERVRSPKYRSQSPKSAESKPSSSSSDRKALAMQRYVYTSRRRNSRASQHDQRLRMTESQPRASYSLDDFELMDVSLARGAPKRPPTVSLPAADAARKPMAKKREEPKLVTYQRYDQPKTERDFLQKKIFGGMEPRLWQQQKSGTADSRKIQTPSEAESDDENPWAKECEDSFDWTDMEKRYVQAEADRESADRNMMKGTSTTSLNAVPRRLDDIHYPAQLFWRRPQAEQEDSASAGPSKDVSPTPRATSRTKYSSAKQTVNYGHGKMWRHQAQEESHPVNAHSSVPRPRVPEVSLMSRSLFSQDSTAKPSPKSPHNEAKPVPNKEYNDDKNQDAESEIPMPEKYVKESAFQRLGGPVVEFRHSRANKW